MNVPCRLVWRESSSASPDAHLLLSQNVHDLAAFLSHGTHTESMKVYPVSKGFFIETPSSCHDETFGTIRLRKVAGEVYVPIHADLVPTFLPDELTVLSKSNGLIFLPGDELLSFDRSRPLAPNRWLAAKKVVKKTWQPFPEAQEYPDRLFRIEWPSPPNAAVEILNSGQPDGADPIKQGADGTGAGALPDEVRPPQSGLGASIVANAGYTMAKILAAAGGLFNAPFLAKMGAALARKSIDSVPRISEQLLGAQEAALREILRQLKSGNVEKFLRKAPIAVADPNNPGKIDTSTVLSDHDIRFSLRSLIAGSGGAASYWLGGGDVWNLLAQEYRRLALEAVKNGDYRRAAYLYGVLLRDIHSAATVLEQGGFFRDAAILYRDKIYSPIKAAAAFDRAGDHDEAIRLYELHEQFELAGDVAQRIGDDSRACELYTKAAEKLAETGQYLAAGKLARSKLGQHGLSMNYFQQGWKSKKVEYLICGTWYYVGLLGERDWPAAECFLDEAETALAPPHFKDAGSFFNQILRAVEGVVPPAYQNDLVDRTKLFFARHIRESKTRSYAAQDLFSLASTWPAPIIRDAIVASSDKKSIRVVPPVEMKEFPVVEGTVLHAIACRQTRDIVIATNVAVVVWRPESDVKVPVTVTLTEKVLGISVNGNGRHVLVLMEVRDTLVLRSFIAKGQNQYERVAEAVIQTHTEWKSAYLPHHFEISDKAISIYDFYIDGLTHRVRLTGLLPFPHDSDQDLEITLSTNGPGDSAWDWSNRKVTYYQVIEGHADEAVIGNPGWQPRITESNFRQIDWITPANNVIQMTGVDTQDDIHWTMCTADMKLAKKIYTASTTNLTNFCASCILAQGRIAGATNDRRIHWLKQYQDVLPQTITLLEWATPVSLNVSADIFTLIARPVTNEVIAVLTNGSVVRVPIPKKG